MEIKNKKAYFNYFIEGELEAGIALVGTEIKSVRKGSVNITDSYVRIKNNEAYIINMLGINNICSLFLLNRKNSISYSTKNNVWRNKK